jgi:predicted RNase H-like HicB family nuclease
MPLHGVIYRDGDHWVSHCLELDIVGQGSTPAEALRQTIELCEMQVHEALAAGDIESIIRPAPPEYWALFYKAGRPVDTGAPARSPIERLDFRQLAA